MAFQMRMALWNAGMIKVSIRIVVHPDTPHDGDGTRIVNNREGDDFLKPKLIKTECKPCLSGFGHVAFAPILRGQPPADFYRSIRQIGET